MRWTIEIGSIAKSSSAPERISVEAPNWQQALRQVRAQAGLSELLSGFSIEVLDKGVRAIDPMARLRYELRQEDEAPKAPSPVAQKPLGPAPTPVEKVQSPKPVSVAQSPLPVATAPKVQPSPPSEPPIPVVVPTPGLDTSNPEVRGKTTRTIGYEGGLSVAQVQAALANLPAFGGKPGASPSASPATTPAAQPAPAKSQPAPKPVAKEEPKSAPISSKSEPPSTPLAKVELKSQPAPAKSQPAPKPAARKPVTEEVAVEVEWDVPTVSAPVPFQIVSERKEDPSASSPLTYRECAYAVEEGTSEQTAERFILERFEAIRAQLKGAKTGQLINLAVFDHDFVGRPLRAPLVTLVWKDWRSNGPELRYPSRPGASIPPPSLEPPPGAIPPVVQESAPKAPEPKPIPAPVVQKPVVQAPAQPVKSSEPPPTKPSAGLNAAPKDSSRSITQREPHRARWDEAKKTQQAQSAPASNKSVAQGDLLAELFEAMADLDFARDALEGADFVLLLALDKLKSQLGLVQLYDINTREFVVVRAVGPGADKTLGGRTKERDPLVIEIMQRPRPLVIDPLKDHRVKAGRWALLDGQPQAILACRVIQSGRFLGIIEIANPTHQGIYGQAEVDGLAYIADRFAEFVAARGLLLSHSASRR